MHLRFPWLGCQDATSVFGKAREFLPLRASLKSRRLSSLQATGVTASLVGLGYCSQARSGPGSLRRKRQLLRRRLVRAQAAVSEVTRPGGIKPSDPVLQDPDKVGTGLYSYADLCEWFQTAPEFDWRDCEIEGELPSDLVGTFYLCGPGRVDRGGQAYKHFLDGDGYISAWRLGEGRASCCGAFVRTPEYQEEEEAGRLLRRGAFGTAKEGGIAANAFDIRQKNLANTNIIDWGGRLLALFEASHPSKVNPTRLAFEGYDDLDGLLRPGVAASSGFSVLDSILGLGGDAFTAHPKMDPVSRSMVGFSWSSPGTGRVQLRVLSFDEHFRRKHEEEPDAEVALRTGEVQPHDFGLSRKWCVFFENQFQMADMQNFLLGLQGPAECFQARPHLPQKVHLAPRRKGLPNIEIEGVTSAFDIHVPHCHDGPPLGRCQAAAGRNPEDLVTIYTTSWESLPEGPMLGNWGSQGEAWPFELPPVAIAPDFSQMPRVRLFRHVFDTSSKELVDRGPAPGCEELVLEHPTINTSFTGDRGCRYIFLSACNEFGASSPMCGYARVDLQSGELQRWWAGNRCFTDEPHFVQRGSGPKGTWEPGKASRAEDDGWVLGVVCDTTRRQSCLCILDARQMQAGPVCKVWLPFMLPHLLHGSFVPG